MSRYLFHTWWKAWLHSYRLPRPPLTGHQQHVGLETAAWPILRAKLLLVIPNMKKRIYKLSYWASSVNLGTRSAAALNLLGVHLDLYGAVSSTSDMKPWSCHFIKHSGDFCVVDLERIIAGDIINVGFAPADSTWKLPSRLFCQKTIYLCSYWAMQRRLWGRYLFHFTCTFHIIAWVSVWGQCFVDLLLASRS